MQLAVKSLELTAPFPLDVSKYKQIKLAVRQFEWFSIQFFQKKITPNDTGL
jgi:hypothetical protein